MVIEGKHIKKAWNCPQSSRTIHTTFKIAHVECSMLYIGRLYDIEIMRTQFGSDSDIFFRTRNKNPYKTSS